MPNTPKVLERLAGLTAIRDVELLEGSLLKTLHDLMQPSALRLVRVDGRGHLRSETRYEPGAAGLRRDDVVLPPLLGRAIGTLRQSQEHEASLTLDGERWTVYALHETRVAQTYLCLATREPLSGMDAHLLNGLLQVYRNFSNLLLEAQTDKLTGLANRKTFDDCITKIFNLLPDEPVQDDGGRRGECGARYWLAMVDIDHFKLVNDRFGHLYGDEVLVLVAQLIKSIFREDDWIFRFGGEEFVLLIRCPDREACLQVLNRLRETVESHDFPQVGRVTISVGVTEMDREIFATTLLDYADQALYHGKQNGRNQVNLFEDLLARGLVKKEEVAAGEVDFF